MLAHQLTNVMVTVACGTGDNAGKVCVHVTGTIEAGNGERSIKFAFEEDFAVGRRDRTDITYTGV